MRYVTVQEITGPDPEPMYIAVVKVPIRAGEFVHDELLCVVGDAVHEFEKTLPDHDWHSTVIGFGPPGYGRDDDNQG